MRTLIATIALVWASAAGATSPSPSSREKAQMPPEMETYTLVILERGPKATAYSEAELEKLQVQHLAHLDKLATAGKILVVGPFADQTNDTMRGACIYAVPLAEAVKLAAEDPMVKAGRLKITAMTWWVGKGYLAFPKAPR